MKRCGWSQFRGPRSRGAPSSLIDLVMASASRSWIPACRLTPHTTAKAPGEIMQCILQPSGLPMTLQTTFKIRVAGEGLACVTGYPRTRPDCAVCTPSEQLPHLTRYHGLVSRLMRAGSSITTTSPRAVSHGTFRRLSARAFRLFADPIVGPGGLHKFTPSHVRAPRLMRRGLLLSLGTTITSHESWNYLIPLFLLLLPDFFFLSIHPIPLPLSLCPTQPANPPLSQSSLSLRLSRSLVDVLQANSPSSTSSNFNKLQPPSFQPTNKAKTSSQIREIVKNHPGAFTAANQNYYIDDMDSSSTYHAKRQADMTANATSNVSSKASNATATANGKFKMPAPENHVSKAPRAAENDISPSRKSKRLEQKAEKMADEQESKVTINPSTTTTKSAGATSLANVTTPEKVTSKNAVKSATPVTKPVTRSTSAASTASAVSNDLPASNDLSTNGNRKKVKTQAPTATRAASAANAVNTAADDNESDDANHAAEDPANDEQEEGSKFIGTPTGRGTSLEKPEGGPLPAPWPCAERDCKTGQTWWPRDGKDSYGRKVISQFFGRNKRETMVIPPEVWHNYCRKHYQTGVYKAKAENNKCMYVIRNINMQLARIQLWRPQATFQVQPDKYASERLTKYYLIKGANGPETAAQKLANARAAASSETRTNRAGKTVKLNEIDKWPIDHLVYFKEHFTSETADQSFNDLKAIIAWVIGLIEAGEIVCLPPMEFLIAEQAAGETVNDKDNNYNDWLALEDPEAYGDNDDDEDEEETEEDATNEAESRSEAAGTDDDDDDEEQLSDDFDFKKAVKNVKTALQALSPSSSTSSSNSPSNTFTYTPFEPSYPGAVPASSTYYTKPGSGMKRKLWESYDEEDEAVFDASPLQKKYKADISPSQKKRKADVDADDEYAVMMEVERQYQAKKRELHTQALASLPAFVPSTVSAKAGQLKGMAGGVVAYAFSNGMKRGIDFEEDAEEFAYSGKRRRSF
ncbi:hypothetical protein BDY17DRAFT_165337 [Neohortaea acidophila]|uniref:Uncharacterized protein n=1 Tax=Neohortaea acidophila TaxID=245834 RepID=A0A6A6PTE2_9PEZI|nr:uncharacterized protein BDY17DRAFT_165337 [Neohortaea acidophila]KAF2482733.1 hypothetical protein BDY17DRAFT_165337 [Neohortaea acidophila]